MLSGQLKDYIQLNVKSVLLSFLKLLVISKLMSKIKAEI